MPLVYAHNNLVHYNRHRWSNANLVHLWIKRERFPCSNICKVRALSLMVKGWLAPSSMWMIGSWALIMGVGMTSACKSIGLWQCSSVVCGDGSLPSSRSLERQVVVSTKQWLVSTCDEKSGSLFSCQIFNVGNRGKRSLEACCTYEHEGLTLGCTFAGWCDLITHFIWLLGSRGVVDCVCIVVLGGLRVLGRQYLVGLTRITYGIGFALVFRGFDILGRSCGCVSGIHRVLVPW